MILEKKLPKLFTPNAGGTRVWEISVFSNSDYSGVIETKYGKIGGKQSLSTTTINNGKNIGKTNETTPVEQALKDAQSKWEKKLKTSFESLTECDSGIAKFTQPMLAKVYDKNIKHIEFPCSVQPKLDGIRCISKLNLDSKILDYKSRTGKEFQTLNGLTNDLLRLNSIHTLDGEIYTKDISFERICSAVRGNKIINQELASQLEYWIYDMAIPKYDFKERNNYLKELFKYAGKFDKERNLWVCGKLIYCPTEEVNTHEEIKQFHQEYIIDGYEGTMIRNNNSPYKFSSTRSNNLLKLKDFVDDEFEIVNVIEGSGKDAGTAIYVCRSNNNMRTFKARPTGTAEHRAKLYENGNDAIGKKLTIKFQNLTRYGIPRFPVGIGIRDYE